MTQMLMATTSKGVERQNMGKKQREFCEWSQTMAQQGMMPTLERRARAGTMVEVIRKTRPMMMRRRFDHANHAHRLSEVKECQCHVIDAINKE